MEETLKSVLEFEVKGVLAAPVTPMTENWDINLDAVKVLAEKIADDGMTGVFISGTLGEGIAMTLEERKRVTEAWVAAAKGRLQYVVAHIGAGNMHDSIELAKHAEKAGVCAISCVCPTYFKATSVEGLILYMKHVAAAVPTLPFYLYEINQVTGNVVDIEKFFAQVKSQIPTLRGMKYSNLYVPAGYNVAQMENGRFQVMTGTDEQMLATASLGLTVNIVNAHVGYFSVKLLKAVQEGNLKEAQKQQVRLQKLRNLLFSRGPDIGVAKALGSVAFGIELGPARPPAVPLTKETREELRRELKALGYFDWKKE